MASISEAWQGRWSPVGLLALALALLVLPARMAKATPRNLNVFVIDWSSVDGTDPIEIWDGTFTQGVDSAFFIAMHHFNERNTTIIPDLARLGSCPINISIVQFCDTGGNLHWAANDVLYAFSEFSIDAIAGFGGIQDVQSGEPIAEYFNVPTVCHWVSDPLASDKHYFPMFSRTIPDDNTNADLLVVLIEQLGYKEIALLYLSDGAQFAQYFSQSLASYNYSVQAVEFQYALQNDNIRQSVQSIAAMGLNVIVCATWALQLLEIADAAAEFGLLSDSYLWIFTYLDRNPTEAEFAQSPNLRRLMHGSVKVGIVMDGANWHAYLDNFASYNRYLVDINSKLPPHGQNNSVSCRDSKFQYQLAPGYFSNEATLARANEVWGYAYDSIMTLGFAACAAHTADGVFPNGSRLYQAILNTHFEGLSGSSVQYDNATGDRLAATAGFALTNWQQLSNSSVLQQVAGKFDAASGSFLVQPNIVFRSGPGLGSKPNYVTVPVENKNFLPLWARVIGYIELVLAELSSIICLLVTALFRADAVFVNGQPLLLGLIALGCCVAAWSILGLMSDDSVSAASASAACMVAPVCFNFGVTLCLASLAAKMWRIWKIFGNKKLKRLTVRVERVLVFVTSLAMVLLILMLVWITHFPLEWVRIVDVADSNGYPVSSHGECIGSTTSLVFLGLVFGISGLSLLITSYLAYHVRSFPSDFQESKYVGILVLSLLQIYVVVVPSVIAVYSVAIGRFLLLTSVVFVTVAVIQGVMFVPKIYVVITKKELWPGGKSSPSVGQVLGALLKRPVSMQTSSDKSRHSPVEVPGPGLSPTTSSVVNLKASPSNMKKSAPLSPTSM